MKDDDFQVWIYAQPTTGKLIFSNDADKIVAAATEVNYHRVVITRINWFGDVVYQDGAARWVPDNSRWPIGQLWVPKDAKRLIAAFATATEQVI